MVVGVEKVKQSDHERGSTSIEYYGYVAHYTQNVPR